MQYVPALMLLGHDRPAAADPSRPSFAGDWSARFEDVGGVHSAYTRSPGALLRLPGLDGPAHLVFMCTDWSGQLEIRAGGEVVRVDTYAPTHTVREVPLPGSGRRDVEVELLPARHADAMDSQVWLHRLVVDRHQPWLDRVTRLTPALDVVNARHGTFMTIRGDVGVSHAIRTLGAWGPEQVALFERLVKPGMTVVDVGANIGHHSVVLARLAGPAGRLLAFEPQPFVHRVLEANLALNGCSNAEAVRCALGASEGEAAMMPLDYAQGAWNVGGLGLDQAPREAGSGAQQRLAVPVRRLDDVVQDLAVDFVKCDAEGYDHEVLKGAQDLLRRCRPMLLLEVAPLMMPGGTEDYLRLYALLESLGYLLLDPLHPDPAQPPRRWSGVREEWDLLALQPQHLERLA